PDLLHSRVVVKGRTKTLRLGCLPFVSLKMAEVKRSLLAPHNKSLSFSPSQDDELLLPHHSVHSSNKHFVWKCTAEHLRKRQVKEFRVT
ncbi:hypothetical protein GOODEAATRI_005346, partial [Goodea atripinnis]